jgi:hypothetical protein
MALEQLNVGNTINDGTGDDLRDAFVKINQNFQELDILSATNLGTSGAEVFAGVTNGVANFRKLVAGNNIVLDELANTIVINGSASDSRFTVTGDTSSLIAGSGINLNIQGANGIVVEADENTKTIIITSGITSLNQPLDASNNDISNVGTLTTNVISNAGTLTTNDIIPTNINGFDYDAIIGRYVEGFDFGTFSVTSSSILDWVINEIGVDLGTFTAPSNVLIDLGNIT